MYTQFLGHQVLGFTVKQPFLYTHEVYSSSLRQQDIRFQLQPVLMLIITLIDGAIVDCRLSIVGIFEFWKRGTGRHSAEFSRLPLAALAAGVPPWLAALGFSRASEFAVRGRTAVAAQSVVSLKFQSARVQCYVWPDPNPTWANPLIS